MPTPTAIRHGKDVVAAVAHQTAFGTPAGTTTVQKWQVESIELDPGFEYIHPRGTTGSYHPKDTHKKVAERPKATVEVLASPKVAPFIWEHTLHGKPKATLAGGEITEANDTGNALSAWVLNGVRPGFNTDASAKIYVTLDDETPGAGQARVSLYSDAAKLNLVAQGSAANNNTITLAEQNNSGLSGTVALAAPTASDTDIELTIVKVLPQLQGTLDRYFTLWVDHGSGKLLQRISDCTIEKLTRVSEERGVVRYRLEVVGADYNADTAAGGTFSAGLAAADKEYYVHGTMTLNTDTDAGNVAQHARKLEITIENDIEVVLANASTASAIWKRGVKRYGLTFSQKLSDEAQVIAQRGVNDTFEAIKVVDVFGARNLTMQIDKAKIVEPGYADFAEDGVEDVEHELEFFEETAGTPAAPLDVTIAL